MKQMEHTTELNNLLQALQDGLRLVAATCDGAQAVDHKGFSKFDAERGHWLASNPIETWIPAAASALEAASLVTKYRGQIPPEILGSIDIALRAAKRDPDWVALQRRNQRIRAREERLAIDST